MCESLPSSSRFLKKKKFKKKKMSRPNIRFGGIGPHDSTVVDFKPTLFLPGVLGGDQTQRLHGQVMEGPHSYDGGITNIRPFWISPLQLFPHNVYLASKIPVADKAMQQANTLALIAELIGSYGIGGLKGMTYLMSAWAAVWLLWMADFPNGFRNLLTSPELIINV